jgi:hypothetical protein
VDLMAGPGGGGCWGRTFEVDLNSAAHFRLGPLELWLRHGACEWRVAMTCGRDALDDSCEIEVPSPRPEPPAGAEVRRFGFREAPSRLRLRPLLADRPVIVSPEASLQVPPGERITLFISTPLWLELLVGEPGSVLLEHPTHRPSDTWFGPSTQVGELCYATRTAARLSLENLPLRPHRAVSEVEIHNGATTVLAVEKLRIPAPQMSVYATEAGSLWTEQVILERRSDDEMASLRLGKGAPPNAPRATLARGPRSVAERGVLTRAFGGLLKV